MNDSFSILNLLSRGKYEITLHARLRMAERKITHSDIRSCGSSGAITEIDGKYKVTGPDCDGETLSIVCVNESGVIIITVF